MPKNIEIRGARVHNLKNVDIDIPIGKLVGISGLSGSGKSSLALGVLYAEGSRRYLESLSAYTRRRMTQASEAKIDSIKNIPASLALHQRPTVPGIRSTFGTMTELLNSIRLMFSRLGNYTCPNGHIQEPTINIAAEKEILCPICKSKVHALSAEGYSFNSYGACKNCSGMGVVLTVDESTLVPDETLTIDQGAVAPWNTLMWSLMKDICREMGVRTDVPYSQLTDKEKEIVLHGPAEKKHILYKAKNSDLATELDFTYYNAVYTVQNALSKVKDEKNMKRVEKFLKQDACPECNGTRLNEKARSTLLCGFTLPQVCSMTLDELIKWVKEIPSKMNESMKEMAESIVAQFLNTSQRLIDLGLGYLTLDRTAPTLSTGELQRIQLARAVRNRTTGVLYVLDEPSIGLHPANVDGLIKLIKDLVDQGNSVLLVDHDTQLLRNVDWLIEMGPGAGESGGKVISQGTLKDIMNNHSSLISLFIEKSAFKPMRKQAISSEIFSKGYIQLDTLPIHTVKSLNLKIPKGRLISVTGVSGSGKTTLVLESLVPAIQAKITKNNVPNYIKNLDVNGINRVHVIDATPIGINVRSTVATYSGILDDLRKLYADTDEAKKFEYKNSDFSYNTGSLRCPNCDGTGQITMDVQFLPDVEIDCPECNGKRYKREIEEIKYLGMSLTECLSLTISQALSKFAKVPKINNRLKILSELGLGYLTLGEATPTLSGGEAQRLKLASELGKTQDDALFVFDEPTIGLHPLDVQTLISVFQILIENGATVVVIEHDLDMIANSDYVIDMGPGGGTSGGTIVAEGSPKDIANNPKSITGQYLKELKNI